MWLTVGRELYLFGARKTSGKWRSGLEAMHGRRKMPTQIALKSYKSTLYITLSMLPGGAA
jgi:hypothetical protein